MKRSIKSLIGYTMGATDGEIGKVKEFYFDDETWTIRYLIVETGNWLSGRKVLIAPTALLVPDWNNKTFPVNLTKEQIKNSPDIDTDKPVSRQQELDLYAYYPWGSYWGNGFYGGGMRMPINLHAAEFQNEMKNDRDTSNDDRHLRSTDYVTGYDIRATDGEIGNVEDYIVDDSSWKIDFMVVETGNFFSGKKVLISPKWINKIQWSTNEVIISASKEDVKNSPEYDESLPVSVVYEKKLYDYYGRMVNVDKVNL